MNKGTQGRLVEIDALRGIAAALVMLFHYTTRYDQLYGHESPPTLTLSWGHYGVNLFFMISGFVIFMTLHRIRRPLDFIVSRFSRLFPSFWVAVVATFVLTRAFELPDKAVTASTAGMNLFMIHGLARIPHVDSVYWTLEIELIFYALALLFYLAGRIDKVHSALLALLALRTIDALAASYVGIRLPWVVSHLLILPYIAWFICGIMIYRRLAFPGDAPAKDLFILIAAIAQLGFIEGVGIGGLAALLSLLLWIAATGRLSLLAKPALSWLGMISYTLYLLHENIGWGVMLHAEHAGIPADLAILIAIALSLAMATVLTRFVERPAMIWIRSSYRRHSWPYIGWRSASLASAAFLTTFSALAYAWHRSAPTASRSSAELVTGVFRPTNLIATPCSFDPEPRPLMILVLGQSNAGNHGEMSSRAKQGGTTTFFFEGKCYRTNGAAPGATGTGSNPWTALGPRLEDTVGRPVVFSVLAVNGTRIRDWVEPGKLRERLLETIAIQKKHGFMPDVVLWQQGEADARAQTTRAKYLVRFRQLVAMLRSEGLSAPIVPAISTRCHSEGSEAVRLALLAAAATDAAVWLGPDIDTLGMEYRHDGCHLSMDGQHQAAELWLARWPPNLEQARALYTRDNDQPPTATR